MSDKPIINSRVVEFPEGSVTVYADGTARFFFRHMDYVYLPGRDSEDGMAKVVDKAVADAICDLFKREYWP
jgi:hypothetical protein